MDRARRTAATARRRTLAGSTSPVSSTPPEVLSSDHPAVTSPPMAHFASAVNNSNSSPLPGPQSRRGSKSPHQTFSFSAPSVSANRGLGLKRRSRTMDDDGLVDDAVDPDSPRKGGHTLRKKARVDYTCEHVEEEVVVPSSTSSRGRKRRSVHGYNLESMCRPAAKKKATSLGGADTAAFLRGSAVLGDELPHEEDVKDTIEVGVSYSDMEDSDNRRGSDASASSAHQSVNGSWNAVPVAAASHFGTLYANETAVVASKANLFNDSRDENIDPQLRASPPVSPKTTVFIGVPDAQGSPPVVRSTDAAAAAAGEHVGSSADTAAESADARQVFADAGAAEEIKETITLPANPAAEEQASAVLDLSFSEEIRQQLDDGAAAVPDPSNANKTGTPASSPEAAKKSSSEDEATPDSTDPSRTAQSPSDDISQNAVENENVAGDHAEDVAEDAASSEGSAVDTTDGVEMACTKQSPPRQLQTTIPSISIEQVAESEENDDAEEGQEQDGLSNEDAEEEEASVPEATKPLPISSEVNGKKVKGSEEQNSMIAFANRDALKSGRPSQRGPSKPQPSPEGRYWHLTPYVDGEYVCYPERKARSDDDTCLDDTTPEDKDAEKDGNDMEPLPEDNDDAPDPAGIDAQTPALNTPLRGSPVPDSVHPTASNSPAPAGEDADDGDMSDSQEPPARRRYYRYRKLRDAVEFISALENYEVMSTAELYEVLGAVNVSLVQWQNEWNDLGKVVDDHENALRRRVAEAKYEARTKNLTQHGVNHEEPEITVKGYKAKERELMSETRYLQGQDRIMSAAYGFEYDPHPSKIGRQNPETQQVGLMTRRSLRNQPKPTVKACEADEVTGKRQRKPVQLFDPATRDVSRSSTPVPARGRKRKNVNADDEARVNLASSFNGDEQHSDAESVVAPKGRRRRGPRTSGAAHHAAGEEFATPRSSGATENGDGGRSGRRRVARQPVRYDETYPECTGGEAPPRSRQTPQSAQHHQHQQQQQQQRRRHLLTLKIPKSKNFSEPSSAITDNGDSRPSTASSASTSHTADSTYSFRPKRQKRFRDDADGVDETAAQAPPRKRGKRSAPRSLGGVEPSFMLDHDVSGAPQSVRKVHKIKVVRPAQDGRNAAALSAQGGDGDEKPKDYKSMTKSEKMSASMKSRWANGNMAGAVEKRKATLAAKKAAQVAADSKVGAIAPKPKAKPHKKEEPEGHVSAGHVAAIPGIGCPFSAHQ